MTKNSRKIGTIIAWVIWGITMLFSQQVLYTVDNHSIQLFEHPNQLITQVADDISKSQIFACVASLADVELVKDFGAHSTFYLLETSNSIDLAGIQASIQNCFEVVRWIPACYLDASLTSEFEFLISDRISVKFNQGFTNGEINQFASEFALQLVKGSASTRRCVFKMNPNNSINPLELAMTMDSDYRTRWGQINYTTPIVLMDVVVPKINTKII